MCESVEKARNPGPCFFIKQGGNSNPGDRINNGNSYASIDLCDIHKLNAETDGYYTTRLKTTNTSIDTVVDGVTCFVFKLGLKSKAQSQKNMEIWIKEGYIFLSVKISTLLSKVGSLKNKVF